MSRLPLTALVALALCPGSLLPAQVAAETATSEPAARPERAIALEEDLRRRLGEPQASLDLDLIMFGPDFFGTKPSGLRWDAQGEKLYFRWKRWNEREVALHEFDPRSGAIRRLPEETPAPPRPVFDVAKERWLWVDGEELWFEPRDGGEKRRLATFAGGVRRPSFSADGGRIHFETDDGLFALELSSPGLEQLLAWRKDPVAAAKKKEKKEGSLERFHEAEQLRLFRRLWEGEERREREREAGRLRRKARPRVNSYEVPKGWRRAGVSLSPDGRHAAISLVETKDAGRRTEMPDYVTRDGYTAVRRIRAKVGDAQPKRRLQVVALADGKVVDVKELEPDRGAWPRRPRWTPDGRWLLADVRTDDDETWAILRVDPATGEAKVLHRVDDPAWVAWSRGREQFLGRSSRAVFLSEKSGFRHLWRMDVEAASCEALTSGAFEVSSPRWVEEERKIIAVATATSPHQRDLVAIDPESGEMTLLTAERGGREFSLSPDGTRIAEVVSRGNRPWELVVRDLKGEGPPVTVTDSPSPAFKSYERWEDPPIVQVPASDGVKVPARIYRPANPLPERPAVIFVHGAGYLQNVHHWWSSYEREYGFHNLLRDEGYLVLDVDYRGSAGYGRDWRCAIHGHMGGRDLSDFVDAAKWLVETEGIDPERIGIYGGSYGGFITLMALFTHPGTFAAGAALRPVTDWAHYNDGYTSNILNDPLETPDTYERSSPIYWAEGLEDHLLVCHGVLDSNVHVQGVLRLQQRLIELRKRNWEVALYPLEGHGFTDAASWSDEYGRIKSLFDRVLRKTSR